MVSAVLASMLLLPALPVRVESHDCPSGAQVEQFLASLLPSASASAPSDLARIERSAAGLRIQLSQAQGAVIAERVLAREGSCSELAELAAVVIASWESDVHPEYGRPHEAPVPDLGVATPATPAPRPAARMAYDAALGASLSYARSFGAGAALVLTWIPRGAGPGLRLLATLDPERTLDLGAGRADWRRWMAGVELDWRLRGVAVDLHGGLVLGWLAANGVGFSQDNRSITSFSPAVSVGARLPFWVTRHLAIWLDLTGLYWTRGQTVYADPGGQEENLPRFQGIASVGLALGRAATDR